MSGSVNFASRVRSGWSVANYGVIWLMWNCMTWLVSGELYCLGGQW